ncbi:MAG: hypothetical protein K2Y27_35230 [Xanthobacteraceae bacterium]|nr:hypothetical protein [Xanthobacteraceae bacterium]
MAEFLRAHDLAGRRIREVGERAFGRYWDDDLRKALGLKSTTQLGSWLNANRAPPDYQDRLIAAIRKARGEEFAATQAAAQARYTALTDLMVEMETNRLPEPRLPSDPRKAA